MSRPADPAAAFAGAMAAAPPGPIGLAVSGGGDSMALLALAADWAAASGRALAAVTVDHGLRPESAAEAAMVARRCAALGIAHDVLCWADRPPRGNLAEAAREARRALIAAWAARRGLAAVALAHTLDDQAETVLMRLARGSGVAGLAAMSPVSAAGGVVWLRPLLTVRRAALRALLRARGWSWVEDPSNRDPARDRARARAMLRLLPRLGLTPERLAMTARHMADARLVLDEAARQLAARAVLWGGHGEARLSPAALTGAPRAILGQLLADLLTAIGGRRHPPRLARIEGLIARLDDPPPAATLHGCLIRRAGAALIVCREPARAAPPVPLADGVTWDRRWRILGPAGAGLSVGALGLPAARAAGAGPGAEILATTPAIRSGGRLIAAPLLGPSAWRAEPVIPDARRRRVLTGL